MSTFMIYIEKRGLILPHAKAINGIDTKSH
jgi:hypothetical protein